MNKLEEKFLEEINALDEIRRNDQRDNLATSCAGIAKEKMKKFAEWIGENEWKSSLIIGSWLKKHNNLKERKTTSELIELYLNQDENFNPDCYSPKDFEKK